FFFFWSLKSLTVSYFLKKNLTEDKILARMVCFLFALSIVLGGMWVSLIAQNNPRNTMTMYVLATMSIGVLWLFEYYEVLAIVIIAHIVFSVAVTYYQHNFIERVLNQFLSLFLLSAFFLISRWIYSLHVNHHVQLHTIEEKTVQLEHAGKAKTEILGIVAHDLRNPLSNIEMLAAMSLNEHMTPEENREHLNLILTSCRNGRAIINDLIELARENDNQNIQLHKMILQDFLTAVYLEWKQNIGSSRMLTLSVTEKPMSAFINIDKFRRVLDNLISNAIKFTYEGGHIHVELFSKDGHVQINVNDDGVGIPENLLPYIFDRFSKAGRSGLHGETSIGLGLSITKKIVSQHNGTIQVRNNSVGTTFSVALPVA
ncbi:MAG: HAMP domain-containing histidine kinase, partial [Mucilaginibacter polytrichastri]|nr:HAMP domain-containing histidine kinase [Mucilaginibacter polytrichastri]